MIFVERGAEFRALRSALAESDSHGARTVLLEGGVACGKSETLEWMSEHAASAGAVVLRATGSPEAGARPLDVVRQLVDSRSPLGGPSPAGGRPLPAGRCDRVRQAVDGGEEAPAAERLAALVREVAADGPVVVAVDDLQYVDVPSLHCLLHLVHHSRRSRLLVVLAQSLCCQPQDPKFDTELLRQPNFRRVRLEPLGRAGVVQMLAAVPGLPSGSRLADDVHASSGGNPLLVRALIEECRTSPGAADSGEVDPAPGGPFGQAVLTCLHRGGDAMRDVAVALAVLGDSSLPGLLSQLAGMTSASVVQALHALGGAGIAEEYRFRHPLARAAVLDSLSPATRRDLHRRAAALLHREGAPVAEVAAHLLAGHDVPGGWGVAVLREAAEEALAGDDARLAVSYLELACEGCADERTRAGMLIRLAAVMWRFNPCAAEERYLAEPLAALRSGRLPRACVGPLAKLMVAHGWLAEARDVLTRLRESAGPEECAGQPEAEITLPWTWTPPQNGPRHGSDPPHEPPPWLATGESRSAITATEHFLQVTPLTDATLAPVVTAVKSLVHSDRIDMAESWCEFFLAEAARRQAPGWRAVFASLRAEIALRQGRLTVCEEYARQALRAVPERNASLFAGGPVATLIVAYTAMGRYDAAARHVNQAVPELLFRNVYGLGYLLARGRYHLATDRAHAALGDFLNAGRLAIRWGVDRPVLLPWRTEAAEACLRLGDREQAERLIADQLQSRDAGNSRVRGVCLRLRAMTVDVKQRPRLLARAVEALQRSGDRLELARALAALGEAHQALGEAARAAVVKRRAWHMARECGVETVTDEAEPGLRGRHAPVAVTVPDGGVFAEAKLSESEKRVAVLAACGYTNREIAEKLCITVSTVEQHLTRVYRKLNITRRQQLPPDLQFAINEIA
jgi:DNA-binding CsgD family transcriptional regulator